MVSFVFLFTFFLVCLLWVLVGWGVVFNFFFVVVVVAWFIFSYSLFALNISLTKYIHGKMQTTNLIYSVKEIMGNMLAKLSSVIKKKKHRLNYMFNTHWKYLLKLSVIVKFLKLTILAMLFPLAITLGTKLTN